MNDKIIRDRERRYLHKHNWLAVTAIKPNGALKNAWIHPKLKGSYSRKDAINITKRNANYNFYTLKQDYFKNINSNNSYWAGFIAADGSIHDASVSIDLHKADYAQLKKLKQELMYNGDLTHLGKKPSIRLYFSHPDITNIFNIKERKSFTLRPPILKNENHIRAYIRGFMDGDGSIYCRQDGYWCVSFNGTKEVLGWIKKQLQYFVPNITDPKIVNHASIYKVTFCGRVTTEILHWIYKYSSYNTRLDRKYDLYKRIADEQK